MIIGNSIEYQVSSIERRKKRNQIAGKTFDYISTGKPIIYIYYNNNDINLEYYKEYPLVLCLYINDNDYTDYARKIEEFCLISKEKKFSFDEIQKYYYRATPSYITTQILKSKLR